MTLLEPGATRWSRLTSLSADFARHAVHGLRTLARAPAFTTVAVVSVGLGIGAATAIFSIVNGVLLRPLPFPEADQLCTAWVTSVRLERQIPSLPVRARDFLEWRRASTSFTGLAAFVGESQNLTEGGDPERLGGIRVSANLFSLLGVQPLLGRTFTEQEDQAGERVAIVSHALWMRRFAADPGLVGRAVTLNGQKYTVVGVLREDFPFPTGTQFNAYLPLGKRLDVWLPMGLTREEIEAAGEFNYGVLARRKPGITLAQAREELGALASDFIRRDMGGSKFKLRLLPLSEAFVGRARAPLLLLGGAAVVLLLITCVNLAHLSFVRVSDRAGEFALRQALGAGRGRLLRQVFTESLLVTLAGGALGALLARPVVVLLVHLAPVDIPRLQAVRVDSAALLFTMAVSVVTGVLGAWFPAWRVLQGFSGAQLKQGGRSATTDTRGGRLRMGLVAGEVALTAGLLLLGALLAQSLVKLTRLDPGFATQRVLTADLALPDTVYREESEWTSFYGALVERLRALPGAAGAGAVSSLPLSGRGNNSVIWPNRTGMSEERPLAAVRTVTGGYLQALGIPLRAGRFLADAEPTPVVVISERLARQFWPDRSASAVVGQYLRLADADSAALEIVGVVGDVRGERLEATPAPHVYRPYAQHPGNKMSVVVRTAQDDALGLAAPVRAAVWSLDARLPVAELTTIERTLAASLAPRRFQLLLVAVFAGLSLVLALSGIFAAVSHATLGRTREIGVRLALGAQPHQVLALVWRQGLVPVGWGTVGGLASAVAGAVVLRSALFGTEPLDPAALVSVAAVVVLSGAVACYLPARRASRVDPTTTMRCE